VAIGKNRAVVRQLRTLFNVGTIRELTDGQLLERFATGDGEPAELAFAALVERHGAMVLRVCRAVLNDPHDTQDAFQATFLVLVKKARGLWVRDSLGPWLHQVAYRTASCARLISARRQRHERSAAALRREARIEVHDDLARVLHEEIERLPERFRVPLILCDLEGRSHEQAARHLGWPIGTVKSRQARGRDRLRDRLRRRGIVPQAAVLAAALRPDPASILVSPTVVDCTIRAAIQSVAARTLVPGAASSLARGVLTSMYMTQWSKVASVLLFLGATASGAGLLAQKGVLFAVQGTPVQAAPAGDVPTTTVKAGKLSVRVIEKGNLEVSEATDAYCLVEGQTTIIMILPDGSAVKKDQIVCQLDSSSLRNKLFNQRITQKSAERTFDNAKLAREVAEIALIEYVEGIYKSDLARLNDAVTAAESAIRKADARLERTRLAGQRIQEALGKKGAEKSSADIMADLDIADRLESAEDAVVRKKVAIERTKVKKKVLENVTKPRTVEELQADIERKRSDELAKKATWELENMKAKYLERQIYACDIKAPADGTITYANSPELIIGRPPQIEEGATVRERQKIFRVIDPKSRMLVNARVHEPHIAKLSRNMKAKIRVDAFADETLSGTIWEIAPLPNPAHFGIASVYTTRVFIGKPLPGLRPGMSAEVEFLVSDLDNVISVPVEAIVRYDEKDHLAVKKADGGWDWREVTLGVSNDRAVEVKEGLKSGEQVAVKPLELLTEQQKREMRILPTPPAAKAGRPQ
jgi:HlyD family secretion protein